MAEIAYEVHSVRIKAIVRRTVRVWHDFDELDRMYAEHNTNIIADAHGRRGLINQAPSKTIKIELPEFPILLDAYFQRRWGEATLSNGDHVPFTKRAARKGYYIGESWKQNVPW